MNLMNDITVKYGTLKKIMERLEKTNLNDESEITFEFLVGSCFPNILNNIKTEIHKQYTKGYIEGKRESKQLNKQNKNFLS